MHQLSQRRSSRPSSVSRVACCALAAGLLVCTATASFAEPSDHGLSLQPHVVSGSVPSSGPDSGLGGVALFPIELALDDGGAEQTFGIAGGTARQFLWLNQFDNPGPFLLEEIQVLFPAGTDVSLGDAIELAVFDDENGVVGDGAELLATFSEVVQANDGTTFSVYTIDPPLEIAAAGDVLIGVINRYFQTGVDLPPTFPAAVDSTVSENQSYFALWASDPPTVPDLASASTVEVLDGVSAGNFLIRGFGRPGPVLTIPTLGGWSLALLAGLIGLLGVSVVLRR